VWHESVTESNRHFGRAGDSAKGRISRRLKRRDPESRNLEHIWMPAFAGMTVEKPWRLYELLS
jgi:hypothetical protein